MIVVNLKKHNSQAISAIKYKKVNSNNIKLNWMIDCKVEIRKLVTSLKIRYFPKIIFLPKKGLEITTIYSHRWIQLWSILSKRMVFKSLGRNYCRPTYRVLYSHKRLTGEGEWHISFLRDVRLNFLQTEPLNKRNKMWFDHDGVLPLNFRDGIFFLNQKYD